MLSIAPQTNTDTLPPLVTEAVSEFQSRFRCDPSAVVASPGRVNLIGEHIDYNDGYVLPMAVERYTVIAAEPARADHSGRDSATAEIYSTRLGESVALHLNNLSRTEGSPWENYCRGVLHGFQLLGAAVPSFQAVIHSNVPLGGGLSSSAALEVSLATLLERLSETQLEPVQKALLCQRAEHEFAGVPCGMMDQFSSVFGRPDELMLIDCRSGEIRPVRFSGDAVAILVMNTNVKHDLATGEYAARRRECDTALTKLGKDSWREVDATTLAAAESQLSATESKRGQHVVTETARTIQAAEAFEGAAWDRVGELMYASHESLRDDYQVSCRELDLLVDLARELGVSGGVFGARMTGGGFGGCIVALVDQARVSPITQSLAERYEQATGIHPEGFATRPAKGAQVLR